MDTNNHTPFPAVAWESADNNKHWHMTSLIRVKYTLVPSTKGKKSEWLLRLNPDQGELFSGDQFYDDDVYKPVRYESDFVTFKANTDIIINAISQSPSGNKEKNWSCAVEVTSPEGKQLNLSQLQLSGERQWERVAKTGWIEGSLKGVKQIPIRYDRAYGGKVANPDPDAEANDQPLFIAYDDYNSVGTGVTHFKMPSTPFIGPQITWANSALKKQKYAAGFGFTHRSWKPRIDFAGSYDEVWLDEQHPYPPTDFDYQHHQAANPELVMDGYIQPHSVITLQHLLGSHNSAWFRLPELHCFSDTLNTNDDLTRHQMNIDTVLIDIDDEDPKEWAVYLSYRYFMPVKSDIASLTFKYLPAELLKEQTSSQTQRVLHHG